MYKLRIQGNENIHDEMVEKNGRIVYIEQLFF